MQRSQAIPAAAAHFICAKSCRPPPKPSCVRGTARMCYYSGLTKTSTALPRLSSKRTIL
ncbi:hypothetical protein M5099_07105 [Neisseria meningitidis]|nr:hypothetical protein [Neisseria meningitidis]